MWFRNLSLPADPEIEREYLRTMVERARHSVITNFIGVFILLYACFAVPFGRSLAFGLAFRLVAIVITAVNTKRLVAALNCEQDMGPCVNRFTLGMAFAGVTWGALLWTIPPAYFESIQAGLVRSVVIAGVALVTLTASPVPRVALAFTGTFSIVGGGALLYAAPAIGLMPFVVSMAILVAILSFGIGMTSQAHAAARTLVENRRMAEALQRMNVELGEALDKADRLARFDALTGIPNRFSFDEGCARADRNRNADESWHFLLFDLDHFKQINDAAGHDGGDAVLRATGTLVSEIIRGLPQGTLAGRIGGEEFALLVPQLEREAMIALGTMICDRIRSIPAPEGFDRRVTTSVGISRWQAGEPMHHAVKRADEALYRSKADGRDRVSLGPIAAGWKPPQKRLSA